jgi:hypothetical protein
MEERKKYSAARLTAPDAVALKACNLVVQNCIFLDKRGYIPGSINMQPENNIQVYQILTRQRKADCKAKQEKTQNRLELLTLEKNYQAILKSSLRLLYSSSRFWSRSVE